MNFPRENLVVTAAKTRLEISMAVSVPR